MKRKKGKIILAAAVLAFGMTGCAENQIPDMTQEEIRAVGEYIAITMMKYDRNHKSRLMELSEDILLPPDKEQTTEPEEPSGMGPVEDTPVIDGGESGTVPGSSYSIEEVLEFPEGMAVAFQDYSLCGYYPENGEEAAFTLEASRGNRIMVLRFQVVNSSAEERIINLLALEPDFRITVNGEYTRRPLPLAMLPNDLSVLSETLAAGESMEAVLLIEVKEEMAENITSIRLDVENNDKAGSFTLL